MAAIYLLLDTAASMHPEVMVIARHHCLAECDMYGCYSNHSAQVTRSSWCHLVATVTA
jgi:hypothetical protein